LTVGQIFNVDVDANDLWNADPLPRWSNADGLLVKLYATGPTKAGPIAAATRRRSRFAEPDPQTSLVLNRHRNDRPPPGGLLLSRLGGPTCAS
jgi:hypothetical protein